MTKKKFVLSKATRERAVTTEEEDFEDLYL
jgi:hypothetical protein